MSNLFKNLELQALQAGITPRTRESREWFRRKAQRLTRINRRELMREEELVTTSGSIVGSMFMFFYDPKHKETLPYYDRFPLVIVVGPAEGGFYGLNLHYLPPALRAKFLDGLMDITNNNRYDMSTKFNIRYNTLKRASKLRYFKPCFKHYLNKHVVSRFALVPSTEWEIATFLPTAQFVKDTKQVVWANSRKVI